MTELPPQVVNPPANLADANRYWERLQGMRVQAPTNSIVLGGRNVFSPADAEIWLAHPDSTIAQRADPYTRRAFRDAHPLDDNYDANNWDGNGYRILIGSTRHQVHGRRHAGTDRPGAHIPNFDDPVTGGLNYTFSKYRIEITNQPVFTDGADPAANHAPQIPNRALNTASLTTTLRTCTTIVITHSLVVISPAILVVQRWRRSWQPSLHPMITFLPAMRSIRRA